MVEISFGYDLKINEMTFSRLIPVVGEFISSIELNYSDYADQENKKFFERVFVEISKHSLEGLIEMEFSCL